MDCAVVERIAAVFETVKMSKTSISKEIGSIGAGGGGAAGAGGSRGDGRAEGDVSGSGAHVGAEMGDGVGGRDGDAGC